jgi:hypothetical protein
VCELLHIVGVRGICASNRNREVFFLELILERLQSILAPCSSHDFRTLACEKHCRRAANTTGRTNNYGDLTAY